MERDRPSSQGSEPRSGGAVKHEELFERLRREGSRWSRNRNFELYQNPSALRTLRRVLWLRQLERDLARAAVSRVRLVRVLEREGVLLELELPSLHLRRRVHLSGAELAALREGPAAARLPAELVAETDR